MALRLRLSTDLPYAAAKNDIKFRLELQHTGEQTNAVIDENCMVLVILRTGSHSARPVAHQRLSIGVNLLNQTLHLADIRAHFMPTACSCNEINGLGDKRNELRKTPVRQLSPYSDSFSETEFSIASKCLFLRWFPMSTKSDIIRSYVGRRLQPQQQAKFVDHMLDREPS